MPLFNQLVYCIGTVALVPDVVEYGNWKYSIRFEAIISSIQSIDSKIGIGRVLTGGE